MRTIPLTRGQVALVDEEDYALVSQYTWQAEWNATSKTFYANHSYSCGRRFRSRINMARLILGLADGDPRIPDHVNHDTLDNRRSNLRIATVAQNQYNARKREGTSSRYKGVSWVPRDQHFVSYITVDKKRKYLGSFMDEAEAAKAYNAAAKEYCGEFALLNEVSL